MPSASEFDPDPFDPERYRVEVLEPARRLGAALPADLLIRYAVPDEIARDAAAFDAHVAKVAKHWRALRQRRVYAGLATALLAAHAELASSGQLSYPRFARRRAEQQAAALDLLNRMATALAATTSIVDRARVTALTALLRGEVSERTVEEVLSRHQVLVVEQRWALPDQPAGAVRSTLAANLAVLGLSLVTEAVFGTAEVRAGFRLRDGFRLSSGARLDPEHLDELRRRHARRALDERKTALDNVLAALGGVLGRPAELDALIVWQLVDVLGPRITAGLPARAIADAAVELGLDRDEAAELAFTLVDQRSFRDPTRAGVQDALNAGELFVARRRAIALPDDDPLRQRVEIEVSRVESLVKDADEARDRGEIEEEAELLSRALALAGSAAGDLRDRLEALPAPAPLDLRATVTADPTGRTSEQVQLTWAPAPARTGGLHYRVLRGVGAPAPAPAAGQLVARTNNLQAIDPDPVPAESLYYSVLASRGGEVWSAAAVAEQPVLVLPEVQQLELEVRDGAVHGSWRMPDGASDVLVTSRPGAPPAPNPAADPEADRRVQASPAGFADPVLTTEVRHYYRISAVYTDRAGRRRTSPGVVRPVTAEGPMEAVHDLRAETVSGRELRVRLSWTAPQRGTVRIYQYQRPPPWPPGSAVRLDELSRRGRPVSGAIESGETAEQWITTPARDGRTYFTAMTVGLERALIGATVSVASVSPITGLRARRYEDRVRLQWDWPADTQICRVGWWPASDSPGSARSADCGRRRYDDDGGFELAVGHRPVVVSVRAVRRDRDGETVSAPVDVAVPGQDVAVHYRFRRRTRWQPWRGSVLILSADRPCRLPPLVVVHSPGRVMPLRADAGTPILQLPALELSGTAPLSIPVPDPAAAGEGWLSCFAATEPTDTGAPITLIRIDRGP
jgi:hypothetical protein